MKADETLGVGTLVHERYRVVAPIGRGGMGAVFEAVDERLGHRVALKQTLVEGQVAERAFEREARLLAGLRHPTLPVVSDYFEDERGRFLVVQFIPGRSLAETVQERAGTLPVAQVLQWADVLLRALEYLHGRQPPVLHRDIKPANLKVTTEGEVVLLDFGLAKGSGETTTTGPSVYGLTPQYAPLEQFQGSGTDPRSDLYALGYRDQQEVFVQSGEQTRPLAAGRYRIVPVNPVFEQLEFEVKAGERSIVRPKESPKR